MLTRKLLLAAAIALTIGVIACAPAPSTQSVSVSYDDFMKMSARPAVVSKEARIPVGGTTTVSLGSNRTTGFSWQEKSQISDASIVQQTEYKFIEPSSKLMGASGTETWTFKGLKKGTTTISNEYGRPWAGGEKGEWKFSLKLTVD